MRHKQAGFSLTEGLLVIIAMTLIVFTGWYIWDSNQDKDKPTTDTTQVKKEAKSDETDAAGTKTISTSKFSLRYPADWFLPFNFDKCGDNFFMAGPTKETAGACASDGGGQVIVSTYTTESGPQGLDEQYYIDFKTESVTVNGVTGTKESGTIKDEPQGIGAPKGSLEISYLFKKNGTYYHARYSQQPSFTDVQTEFDTIVKSLRFK